jgi:hypothetical protein
MKLWSQAIVYLLNSICEKQILLQINGKKVSMQLDTGAGQSVLSSRIWKQLGSPKLKYCTKAPVAYDGHELKCLGMLVTDVEFNGKFVLANFMVLKSSNSFGLLGRDLITENGSNTDAMINNVSEVKYLPVIKGFKASMKLKPDAVDKYCPARPVPIALQEKVTNELQRLEQMGVITQCEPGGSANASPVVWIKKKDGNLRMCADFKVHVNGKIESESYPIPNIETVFSSVKNSKYFAKLDLSSAYWQIELDDEAKKLSVINTTNGLYTVNRLQMGMKNSAAIFQRCIEQCLAGTNGKVVYQDDVLAHAETIASLRKRKTAIRNKLTKKVLR